MRKRNSSLHLQTKGMGLLMTDKNKTQTKSATQAFCEVCKRPVKLPHECPGKIVEWVKIKPNMHRGM